MEILPQFVGALFHFGLPQNVIRFEKLMNEIPNLPFTFYFKKFNTILSLKFKLMSVVLETLTFFTK